MFGLLVRSSGSGFALPLRQALGVAVLVLAVVVFIFQGADLACLFKKIWFASSSSFGVLHSTLNTRHCVFLHFAPPQRKC